MTANTGRVPCLKRWSMPGYTVGRADKGSMPIPLAIQVPPKRQVDSPVQQAKARLREFLLQFIQHPDLHDDADIFASGFVNSLFALQLILFVESEFGIQIENEDLKLDNFRSINALADLIRRKRKTTSSTST
jgi:acyl carrier protein